MAKQSQNSFLCLARCTEPGRGDGRHLLGILTAKRRSGEAPRSAAWRGAAERARVLEQQAVPRFGQHAAGDAGGREEITDLEFVKAASDQQCPKAP